MLSPAAAVCIMLFVCHPWTWIRYQMPTEARTYGPVLFIFLPIYFIRCFQQALMTQTGFRGVQSGYCNQRWRRIKWNNDDELAQSTAGNWNNARIGPYNTWEGCTSLGHRNCCLPLWEGLGLLRRCSLEQALQEDPSVPILWQLNTKYIETNRANVNPCCDIVSSAYCLGWL